MLYVESIESSLGHSTWNHNTWSWDNSSLFRHQLFSLSDWHLSIKVLLWRGCTNSASRRLGFHFLINNSRSTRLWNCSFWFHLLPKRRKLFGRMTPNRTPARFEARGHSIIALMDIFLGLSLCVVWCCVVGWGSWRYAFFTIKKCTSS